MLINIHGKNVDITEAMVAKAQDKLDFMDKYFDVDDSFRANVVVKIYPDGQKVEITITSKIGLLRAEVKSDSFYSAFDLAVDKLEQQIRRNKKKFTRKNRESLTSSFLQLIDDNGEEEAKLVRTKAVAAQEMDLNEAILKMELLGHSFFIYTDEETSDIAVVYKRNDGGYGLLEVER